MRDDTKQVSSVSIANREQIENRLREACDDLDELYPGYADRIYETALAAIALAMKHSYEPIAVNKRIQSAIENMGTEAHRKREGSGKDGSES